MNFRNFDRLQLSIFLLIAAIGTFGQSYMLYHELSDCLPYKEIDYYAFSRIGTVGLILAPIAALTIGLISSRRNIRLALVIPVLLAPLIFGLVFGVLTGQHPFLWENSNGGILDTVIAAQKFYNYVLRLSFTGSLVGLLIAAGMSVIFRKTSLK